MLDSWPERSGFLGAALTLARYSVWFVRRRRGADTAAPIFGWLARRALVETLLVAATIRLRTANAKIDRLEAEIEQMRTDSDGSVSGRFDLPGATPIRSRKPSAPPSASTSAKPDATPN